MVSEILMTKIRVFSLSNNTSIVQVFLIKSYKLELSNMTRLTRHHMVCVIEYLKNRWYSEVGRCMPHPFFLGLEIFGEISNFRFSFLGLKWSEICLNMSNKKFLRKNEKRNLWDLGNFRKNVRKTAKNAFLSTWKCMNEMK